MATRKVHYFDDCDGFYSSRPGDVKISRDLRECTCGQCKGRILDEIRSIDWRFIDDATFNSLAKFATNITTDDEG